MKLRVFLFALTSMAAYGGTITFGSASNGTTTNAVDITGFATLGSEMAGMQITGSFSSGGSVLCTWATTGATSGGCTGLNGANGFQLALTGDSFSNNFSLSGITGGNLLQLVFEGLPGFTVFDRTSPNPGTDGSSAGDDASGTTSPANVNGVATYANRVATLGNLPVGDIYSQVTITFSNGGLAPGSTASIDMDTDNIGLRGGTPGSGVPEPSTLALLGAGFLGLAAFKRRRSA